MKVSIVGTGKMALAMARGLKKRHELEVVGRNKKKAQEFAQVVGGEILASSLGDFDISEKNVILCVKPAALGDIAACLKGEANLLVSILAGTKLIDLKSRIRAKSTVRAMPNLAAAHLQSMTTLTGDKEAKEKALELFSAVGNTLWVDTEKELDIATAVAGSGPAYLALVAEALADGAVRQGLKRADAAILVQGLFEGFAPLLSEKHPALIKDEVMSPGGTTAAGYAALEESGTRSAFIKAIERAFNRTKG